ncbi:uncharacterized protein [Ambystoma mexicanum]|uniref:uncharacterized protein isoform X3 n=1 Tax=Ambystoma mexicanum TaxID=8296 RepID=UPI0037E8295A
MNLPAGVSSCSVPRSKMSFHGALLPARREGGLCAAHSFLSPGPPALAVSLPHSSCARGGPRDPRLPGGAPVPVVLPEGSRLCLAASAAAQVFINGSRSHASIGVLRGAVTCYDSRLTGRVPPRLCHGSIVITALARSDAGTYEVEEESRGAIISAIQLTVTPAATVAPGSSGAAVQASPSHGTEQSLAVKSIDLSALKLLIPLPLLLLLLFIRREMYAL